VRIDVFMHARDKPLFHVLVRVYVCPHINSTVQCLQNLLNTRVHILHNTSRTELMYELPEFIRPVCPAPYRRVVPRVVPCAPLAFADASFLHGT
jgi:hypothetical protein